MTIFDFLKDILYRKSDELLKNEEFQSEFNPYMTSRWVSMHSDMNVKILNATINQLYKAVPEKEQSYKLFLTVLPKAKFRKFGYIKKTGGKAKSTPKTNIEQAIKLVAQSQKISEREVKMYIEEHGLDISSVVKSVKE